MFLEQFRGRKKISEETVSLDESSAPAGLTDRGAKREVNEDRYLMIQSPVGEGYFVFDGMGGAPGGEAAAHLSQEATRRVFNDCEPSQESEVVLRAALQKAHQAILLRRGSPEFSAMGTTVVGAVVNRNEVVIASVGDSRAYVMNDGTSEQLTSDHTFVQQLVDQGHIQPQDALLHPQAHILTRCIGSSPEFELDVQKFWIWPADPGASGDILLLCSDGLYSVVTDDEMSCIVSTQSPSVACEKLIALAIERGGYDNITAIVVPISGRLRVEPLVEPAISRQRHLGAHSRQTRERSENESQLNVRASPRQPINWPAHSIALSGLAVITAAITLVGFVFLKVMAN